MKKILTVVGARPQFIKAAVVSKEIRKKNKEILVHTGQHYDYNMSDIFFEEMGIPKPDYNLGISGGSHGEMTGRMIIALEDVMNQERPDMVLLYGDTNSTMAAALSAVKLHIPICHVEAGNRLGTLNNPEEVNRIVTDHISSILCCCTQSAFDFLCKEGLENKAYLVGDPMYDAFIHFSDKVSENQPEQLLDLFDNQLIVPDSFYYLTCHREENTASSGTLTEILNAMNVLDEKCIYPVHPRNQETVKKLISQNEYENIFFCKPVGYLMSVFLVNHAKKIVTDSGGLQREAYFAKKQCVTVFDRVVWPETMSEGRNQLAHPEKGDIINKLNRNINFDVYDNPFGNGNSAKKIEEIIEKR